MKNKKDNDKRSYILTKETLGITLMLFCALVFIMLLSGDAVFMGFGKAVCTFMYGTFGYGSYIAVAALAYLGEWLAFEKKIGLRRRVAVCIGMTAFCLFLLFHAVSTRGYEMTGYGNYLAQCYHNAAEGYSGYTFGGVISGLLVYPVAKVMTFAGAYVIFSVLSVLFGALCFIAVRNEVLAKTVAKVGTGNKNDEQESFDETAPRREENAGADDRLYSVNEDHEIVNNAGAGVRQAAAPQPGEPLPDNDDRFSRKNLGRQILFENGEFAAESYRRNMIYNDSSYFNHPVHNDGDYLKSFSDGSSDSADPSGQSVSSYTDGFSHEAESGGASRAPSYVYGDTPVSDLGVNTDRSEETAYNTYTVDRTAAPLDYGQTESFADDEVEEESVEPPYTATTGEETDQMPQNGFDGADINFTDGDRPSGRGAQPYSQPDMPSENYRVPDVREAPADNAADGVADDRVSPAQEENQERPRTVNLFDIFNSSNDNLTKNLGGVEPDTSVLGNTGRDRSRERIFDDEEGEDDGNLFGDEQPLNDRRAADLPPVNEERTRSVGFGADTADTSVSRITRTEQRSPAGGVSAAEETVKPAEPEKSRHVWKKYVRPTLDLLADYPENNGVNTGEIEENKEIICETLANFRIDSRIANVVVGPAITRYDVIIEDRTNIKNALRYRDAIAMALMKENVNAYLNYAKGAISIEVPNAKRTTVGLKTMLASNEFINAKPNSLTFTLGKNVDGQVVCPDITKMPHLLVAGTTGSGKSICLSALIISLLYKYGPEELRFILVDPKQVEFISYDKLPHLMINEIIYDVDKAMKALNWAIKEMERRYALFKTMTESGIATKNLTEYNAHLPEGEEKLPKIVIILDEFGDLMLQAKKEIESRIIRLVQKARACGIHLILATQRPSVDCITGLIKSNLPTRIGFKVNSFDDSRCIFDIGGAEKLLGKGDLYFRSAENPDLARIQGCFIDTPEVQKVTDFIKANNETYFDESVSDFINKVEDEQTDSSSADDGLTGDPSAKVDDTFIKALWFCVTSNQASVSMIQRRFPIGYMKACKIIDWMENMNYITQSEGSKPRKVLLSRDEFIQKYGEVDD